MMLATWLLEIYLNKCNTLEDLIASESATSDVETLQLEREMVEDDLQSFMKDYKANLDPAVVYELIQGHGRTDLYLFFAELNKDWGKIVEHWIAEEQWDKAIEILSRQDDVDLYYRFSSLLMRNAPRATVDAWIRQSSLSPRRLIPALLLQKSEPLESNQAVRYLEHVIHRQGSTDSTIYNLLLTLYACDSNEDDAPLIRFLSTCPDDPLSDKPYYDLDYALRLCKKHGRIQACVLIYSRMGLYENSVDLALEKGDLELAKENADKPEDDLDLRKKLWLKIAKYVVQEKSDIKSAMRFLEATDLVKIEDILPFFPDFVVIDDFKTEICTALEDYSARIEELKKEMTAATRSAESIKRDIEALSSRFVAIETSDKCWRCDGALTARQFYVFPCQHSFHTDCLISMVSLLYTASKLTAGDRVPPVALTPANSAPAERARALGRRRRGVPCAPLVAVRPARERAEAARLEGRGRLAPRPGAADARGRRRPAARPHRTRRAGAGRLRPRQEEEARPGQQPGRAGAEGA